MPKFKINKAFKARITEAIVSYCDARPGNNQSTLGVAVGVSKVTVSNWIKGRYKSMKVENVGKLSSATGYSFTYLLYGELPKLIAEADTLLREQPAVSGRSDLSPTEKRILNLWRSWTPTVKQYVFAQMKVADYTKDVLANMFLTENAAPPVTQEQIDEGIIDSVSEAGEFKKLTDGR